jgi:hypothetical protein
MLCDELEKLKKSYLDAFLANVSAGRQNEEKKIDAVHEATMETRAACEAALAALNRHRNEHGCRNLTGW